MYTRHSTEQKRSNHEKLSLYFISIWVLYIVLGPFYFFPSGNPQIADILLVLGIFPAITISFLQHNRINFIYLTGIIFACFTLIINIVHYSFYPDFRFIKSSLYYIYNFLVFAFILFLFNRDTEKFLKITYVAILVSIVIELLYAKIIPPLYYRNTGSFNNPNQLGYWSLLCLAMLVVIKQELRFKIQDFLAIIILLYLQALALSKAGIITFIIAVFIVIASPLTKNYTKIILSFFFLCLIIFALFSFQKISEFAGQFDELNSVVQRLENIGHEKDDSAEGRGYDRILAHPEFLLWGAGEGGYHRFGGLLHGGEIHSGLGAILFSYGITGFGLFFFFVFQIFQKQKWFIITLLVPIMLHGVVHQNVRFTHFWVFLGLCHGMHIYLKNSQKKVETTQNCS